MPQGVDAAPFEKWLSSAPSPALNTAPNMVPSEAAAKPAAKPMVKSMSQASAGEKAPFDDELDAINARLRDAYESPENVAGI